MARSFKFVIVYLDILKIKIGKYYILIFKNYDIVLDYMANS